MKRNYRPGKYYKPGPETVIAAVPPSWLGEELRASSFVTRYRLTPPHPLRVVRVNSGGAIADVWHLNDIVNEPEKGRYPRWLGNTRCDRLRYLTLCGHGCANGVRHYDWHPGINPDRTKLWCRACYEYAARFDLLPPLDQ